MDKLAPIIISNSAIASSLLDSTANTPICDLMESVFGAIDAPLPVAYAANLLCRQMPPQMPKELSVRPFGIPLPSPVPLSHWHRIERKCTEHSKWEKNSKTNQRIGRNCENPGITGISGQLLDPSAPRSEYLRKQTQLRESSKYVDAYP